MKPVDQFHQCGYIAIVGRPNVGKSTLLNELIGQKISIISPKPQTTRHQILGIKTINTVQAIYIDTPGLHPAEQRAMNRYMNRLASSVIPDADVVIFMIEAMRWYNEDDVILEKLRLSKAPIILVINKVDLLKNKSHLLPLIDRLKTQFSFSHIVPLSAKNRDNIATLEKLILPFLPKCPHLFPMVQVTDKDERFQIAEIIREKLIYATSQEIPYSTTVMIESLKLEGNLLTVHGIIWVEREGQKPIVIGKNGERLKKISTQARKDIEKLLKKKVFLRLWVKVKSNWTDNSDLLQGLGFE
ncbi:MAG: era [Gammaproteobacteria bacterium]|jgi:GTP-binding protein Era|nr:era [Gammaproteobacteria bacterium]